MAATPVSFPDGPRLKVEQPKSNDVKNSIADNGLKKIQDQLYISSKYCSHFVGFCHIWHSIVAMLSIRLAHSTRAGLKVKFSGLNLTIMLSM